MIEFLDPLGWLVCLAALVPVAAALLHGRRERHAREVLGLPRPRLPARVGAAAAGVAAIVLLAAAAARPAVPTGSFDRVRTDAQIFFLVDVSRSMLARERGGRSRFDRARRVVGQMQAQLADVPAGIASLTDRPLPHLFPTTNRQVISSVLRQSLGIEQPPPEAGDVAGRATTFDPIVQLATAGYFAPRARHRLVVLLTDGESARYSPATVAKGLRKGHVGLLVVRFWHAEERVFANGRAESYRPDAGTLASLRSMAERSVGLFGEHQVPAATHAARVWLGRGPVVRAGRPRRLELAPYAAAAAIVPLALVLWRRDP